MFCCQILNLFGVALGCKALNTGDVGQNLILVCAIGVGPIPWPQLSPPVCDPTCVVCGWGHISWVTPVCNGAFSFAGGGLPAAIAGGVGIAGWIARNGPLVCLVGGLDILGGVTLVGADRALASVV